MKKTFILLFLLVATAVGQKVESNAGGFVFNNTIQTPASYTVGLDSLTLTALADTIDVALGNKWIVSLTRNDTIYFKGWPAFPVTADLEITVVQTGTYTLVFSGVRWSGTAPTITATANKIDSFAIVNRKGYVLGFPGVQGM